MSRGGRIALWAVSVLVVLILLPLHLIGMLLFGWIGFMGRVLPSVRIEPGGLALAAACVVGVALIGHLMARWIWREMGPAGRGSSWRLRWTLGAVGLVVLMFACGIAATGVVHQTGWLFRSDQPMFHLIRPSTAKILCSSDMRQIGQSLAMYAESNAGRLPDSLAPIRATERHLHFACRSGPGFEYVYYGRGLTWPAGADIPILAEPLANHEGEGMTILFGNGDVRFVEADEAITILARCQRGHE